MTTKQVITEVSLKASSFSFSPGPTGGVIVQANFEGTATGFGTVCGTMNASPAGQPSGTWDWCGVTYPETGDSLTGAAHGTFSKSGANRWATKGVLQISDGRVGQWEGELDLATRVWSGKVYSAG